MDYASNVLVLSHFIEKHLEFLTIKDILNLFLTSKAIYRLQTSFPFLAHIGHRCTDPDQPYSRNLRRYFKKLLQRYKTEVSEKTVLQVKTLKDLETKYVLSRNTILNSSGKYQFQGWKITANGGDKWVVEAWGGLPPKNNSFVTSYGTDTMHYMVPVEKFLTPGITVEDLMKRAIFKGGCYMSRRVDCKSHGDVTLIAYDTEEQEIFKQQVFVSDQELSTFVEGSYSSVHKKIEICFKPSEVKDKNVKFLKLVLSGQDEQYWAGWYGARFSAAYIRCYYNDIEGVSSDLVISRKVDRKLTLEEESKMIERNNTTPTYEDPSSKMEYSDEDDDCAGGLFG